MIPLSKIVCTTGQKLFFTGAYKVSVPTKETIIYFWLWAICKILTFSPVFISNEQWFPRCKISIYTHVHCKELSGKFTVPDQVCQIIGSLWFCSSKTPVEISFQKHKHHKICGGVRSKFEKGTFKLNHFWWLHSAIV